MNVRMGRRNFSACRISRRALRYPSGLGMPKLHLRFSSSVLPFRVPMTVTGRPWYRATPPRIAASSPQRRSPFCSKKSVNSASI